MFIIYFSLSDFLVMNPLLFFSSYYREYNMHTWQQSSPLN